MKDGSKFVGDFKHGQITGKGVKTYEDDMVYNGEWLKGERMGYGECQYGKRNYKETFYKGDWNNNVRHGMGELGLKNGNIIKGSFVDNQPHGECTIHYRDGGCFTGNLNRGVPEGKGNLISEGFVYTGIFAKGKREGEGILEVQDGSYVLKSLFVNDDPEYTFNRFTMEVVGPKFEEAPVETKAKPAKDAPKVMSKFTEQEEATYGPNKIYYEFKRPVEPTEGSTDDL